MIMQGNLDECKKNKKTYKTSMLSFGKDNYFKNYLKIFRKIDLIEEISSKKKNNIMILYERFKDINVRKNEYEFLTKKIASVVEPIHILRVKSNLRKFVTNYAAVVNQTIDLTISGDKNKFILGDNMINVCKQTGITPISIAHILNKYIYKNVISGVVSEVLINFFEVPVQELTLSSETLYNGFTDEDADFMIKNIEDYFILFLFFYDVLSINKIKEVDKKMKTSSYFIIDDFDVESFKILYSFIITEVFTEMYKNNLNRDIIKKEANIFLIPLSTNDNISIKEKYKN